eukprot:TRINITY_DN8711_c0_g1_i2.p1 TRINITY_DN8711_c0_g1~~TRINITY_DN8711_c0_g1_i2.p1  ORF type:complete len:1199 (-),score=213.45 TRINITY_DN8711_c0_g1_i2:57-3563(-)
MQRDVPPIPARNPVSGSSSMKGDGRRDGRGASAEDSWPNYLQKGDDRRDGRGTPAEDSWRKGDDRRDGRGTPAEDSWRKGGRAGRKGGGRKAGGSGQRHGNQGSHCLNPRAFASAPISRLSGGSRITGPRVSQSEIGESVRRGFTPKDVPPWTRQSTASRSNVSSEDGLQLEFKNSFISVVEPPAEVQIRRRATSEPPVRSRNYTFAYESLVVSDFSDRMNRAWEDNEADNENCTVNDMAHDVVSSAADQSEHIAFSEPANYQDISRMLQNTATRSQNRSLRSRLRMNIAFNDVSWQDRLRRALDTIDDLPEQVADVLRARAISIADDVQGEVASTQAEILDGAKGAMVAKAVECLEQIPGIIFQTFDSHFDKATSESRERVELMLRQIARKEDKAETIVEQMRRIPEDVQAFTATATDLAVQASIDKIEELIDDVVAWLVADGRFDAQTVSRVKQKITSKVPAAPTQTLRAARAAAVQSVECAVAAVRHDENGHIPNKTVADALLRAKALTPIEMVNVRDVPRARKTVTKPGGYTTEKGTFPSDKLARDVSKSSSKETSADSPLLGVHKADPEAESKKRRANQFKFEQSCIRTSNRQSPSDCPLFYHKPANSSLACEDRVESGSAPAELGNEGAPSEEEGVIHQGVGSESGTSSTSQEDVFASTTLPEALAGIRRIPTQLVESLRARASDLASAVEDELARMRVDFEQEASPALGGAIGDGDMSSVFSKPKRVGGPLPSKTQPNPNAMDQVFRIPQLIMESFEAKLDRVEKAVRDRINHKISKLTSRDIASEQIVTQLWAIPEEVEQIASEAVEEAVQEYQQQAKEQVDNALMTHTGSGKPGKTARKVSKATKRIIDRAVPNLCGETDQLVPMGTMANVRSVVRAVETTTRAEVAYAVGVEQHQVSEAKGRVSGELPRSPRGSDSIVSGSGSGSGSVSCGGSRVSGTMANGIATPSVAAQTVSDAVTKFEGTAVASQPPRVEPSPAREEVAPVAAPTNAVASFETAINPGSFGHPELCSRPCLFNPTGDCKSGDSCDFCHMTHVKRPAHLDKRHREILKVMPFSRCIAVMEPILRDRVQSLRLSDNVVKALDGVVVFASTTGVAPSGQPYAKDERPLYHALKVLSLRALLTSLHRLEVPPSSPAYAAICEFVQAVRDDGVCAQSLQR